MRHVRQRHRGGGGGGTKRTLPDLHSALQTQAPQRHLNTASPTAPAPSCGPAPRSPAHVALPLLRARPVTSSAPRRRPAQIPGLRSPLLRSADTSPVATAKMSTSAPAGPSAASGSNRRLQQTQNQVDEVVDIMRVNVDKVLERDQKLSELDDRADALQAGASQFETSAAKLKRKYWWKNCKMWAIGISVLVIIIIIIIVWSVSS
ncbi:vesicle-associated membrane protein 3 [Rhynchonycteris naso]